MTTSLKSSRIALLNDRCRQAFGISSKVVMTQGVAMMPPEDISAIREKVERFRDFKEETDPWGEHDFGSFEQAEQKIFWKIDYYDLTMENGSEDPADPTITRRLLTIMLAEEY